MSLRHFPLPGRITWFHIDDAPWNDPTLPRVWKSGELLSYALDLKKKKESPGHKLAILVHALVTFLLLIFAVETFRVAMAQVKWSLIDPCHLHVWHGSPWGLGCFKQLFVDRANLWFETHVQQAIRFVQDQTFDVTNLKTKGSNFLAISLKA